MYEARYCKYITTNKSRFATPQEIKNCCLPISRNKNLNGCGVPLYYDNEFLYVDSSDSHYYIQGQTGCKKSRIIDTNTVNSIIHAGESFVVNDPKGETYRRTYNAAKENGYKISVLNLRDVDNSNGWNPLNLSFEYYSKGNIAEAEQCINDFVEAVMTTALDTSDKYWPESAAMLLTYCVELLIDSVPMECFNMANVIQMTYESNASILKDILAKMDQTTTAAICMHSILDLTAEKTSSCIYSTLKQGLKPFIQNKSLLNLLCNNDINYEDLVKKKTAIYIIYPDEKSSLAPLITLFFTQCYQYLVTYSSKFCDAKLPIRVNFVLDEFSNLPAIDNFDNRISEARGHNIRYFLISQSFGQLRNKYKETADTIVSNCDWIIFPSKEYEFMDTVSKMCGKEYDYYGVEHNLMDISEIAHLKKYQDGAEALILKSGEYPFVTKLPDYKYTNIFKVYSEVNKINIIKSDFKPEFIDFRDWIAGINNGTYNFPFPKKKRTYDYNANKSAPSSSDRLSDDIKKKLEDKWDELFGPLDSSEG